MHSVIARQGYFSSTSSYCDTRILLDARAEINEQLPSAMIVAEIMNNLLSKLINYSVRSCSTNRIKC